MLAKLRNLLAQVLFGSKFRDPECVVSLLLITDMMGDISRKLVPRDDHGIEVLKDACRLHGSIPVDKVKGNFHILSGLYNLKT